MNKTSFLFFLLVTGINAFADDGWQIHWHRGHELYWNREFVEAAVEFDRAVGLMNGDELEKYPYVLVNRAENNFSLENASNVLEDTERALKSAHLTEHERLTCSLHRLSAFTQNGDYEAALQEYNDIIESPLFPKYDFFKEKIIIRNIPDCACFKTVAKEFLLSEFCAEATDIHDYESLWVVDVTKDCLPDSNKRPVSEAVKDCCKRCNSLSAEAQILCGSLPNTSPNVLSCKAICIMFVEGLRQSCESCCHQGDSKAKCSKYFEGWKEEFKNRNPQCPSP